ncbi:MAG: hypothetical protein ACRED5_21600 [Propylenella sp.]
MQRPFLTALAAIVAVGAVATTFAPANAAPMRAMPTLVEQAGQAGVEQVRHRRDRDWEHRRHSDNRWRHFRKKRSHPYAFYRPFYFPNFGPPRHHFYFGNPPRRHRNW